MHGASGPGWMLVLIPRLHSGYCKLITLQSSPIRYVVITEWQLDWSALSAYAISHFPQSLEGRARSTLLACAIINATLDAMTFSLQIQVFQILAEGFAQVRPPKREFDRGGKKTQLVASVVSLAFKAISEDRLSVP